MNPISHSKESSKKEKKNRVNIEDFINNFRVPTSVMKDGLLFIWVEKEVIS